MMAVAVKNLCVCIRAYRGRCVDVPLALRDVRLTSCGRYVDINADLRDASSLQRCHASVRAKVSKLQVYDVQVGGSGWDVRIRLGDDHTLWAPQGAAILQPAKCQLLWRSRLHLRRTTRCYLCCLHVMTNSLLWEMNKCICEHISSVIIPDKISWLHVQSGCCHRCGMGQVWSKIDPFSKLWRENIFVQTVHVLPETNWDIYRFIALICPICTRLELPEDLW